jgi:hypothetical protein
VRESGLDGYGQDVMCGRCSCQHGDQSMKTEGPGTDEAGVLGVDVMVNTVLPAVEAPATREARTLS